MVENAQNQYLKQGTIKGAENHFKSKIIEIGITVDGTVVITGCSSCLNLAAKAKLLN